MSAFEVSYSGLVLELAETGLQCSNTFYKLHFESRSGYLVQVSRFLRQTICIKLSVSKICGSLLKESPEFTLVQDPDYSLNGPGQGTQCHATIKHNDAKKLS